MSLPHKTMYVVYLGRKMELLQQACTIYIVKRCNNQKRSTLCIGRKAGRLSKITLHKGEGGRPGKV